MIRSYIPCRITQTIMKFKTFFLLTASVLALTGCSSTPAKVDSGPVQARTFSFVNRKARPTADYTDNRPTVHTLIHGAISKNLATKGVSNIPTGGDITVGYLLIVGNNATTTTIDDYFGYGEDQAALQDKAHAAYTQNKNPNYFEAGTLVIDIIDSKTNKLLKRGYASRPVLRDLPADARGARIQEVVDEILRNLRVGG